jgi:hypothetical protein
MPTNRRKIDRNKGGAITPEVVASWHAADYSALHTALGLKPWQESPLPPELHGIDEATADLTNKWGRQSLRLQRKLMKLCGWPNDCRHVYEEDLKEAISWRDYCLELIRHPEYGGQGTGCDPISRRRKLEKAEEKVAYYKHLLDALDETGP